jgi:dTMP kinase
MSGLLITFEGIEGAGKTTQIRLLQEYLLSQGKTVVTTREPGGDPVAEALRAVVLAADATVTPTAELLVFLAARAQHAERVLRPRLLAGAIVLCDRYIDSTVAYQGYGRGHDLQWVRRLNDFATGSLMPALTILLDLPVESGLSRQPDRNRMEAENLDFHHRVRMGYLSEARLFPERFRVVDAARSVGAIHADILREVREVTRSTR